MTDPKPYMEIDCATGVVTYFDEALRKRVEALQPVFDALLALNLK